MSMKAEAIPHCFFFLAAIDIQRHAEEKSKSQVFWQKAVRAGIYKWGLTATCCMEEAEHPQALIE